MKLVTFSEPFPLGLRKSAGVYHVQIEAFTNYVFHPAAVHRLANEHDKFRDSVFRVSDMASRITHFHAKAMAPGARILLYNGSGGFGDQILTWPVARILNMLGFKVHLLTEAGNNVCWLHFPFIEAIHMLPLPLPVWNMFDGHLIFDTVSNSDEHPDQLHPVDKMLTVAGINPSSIQPELKRVAPNFTSGEMAEGLGTHADKQIALYQLTATAKCRTLQPQRSAMLLRSLAEAFPQFHWLGLHDEFNPPEYAKHADALKISNMETMRHPNIRGLWAFARRAKVVVSPDSMMVHVAGSQGIPCVGLWGPVDPKNRVAYYPNHYPIWHKTACKFAPCHNFRTDWPKFCPGRDQRTACEVLETIRTEEVIEAVKKAISA